MYSHHCAASFVCAQALDHIWWDLQITSEVIQDLMACGSYMEVIELKRKYKPQKNTGFHPGGKRVKYPLKLLVGSFQWVIWKQLSQLGSLLEKHCTVFSMCDNTCTVTGRKAYTAMW